MKTLESYATEPLNGRHVPKRALNVLVLDDMESDRVRVRRLLRKAGLEFELFEAEDLESFRERIDQEPMDLVFIDYHLAIDTGMDALRALAAHEDQVDAMPIMVTSADQCEIAVEAMRSGCADYLVKEQLSVDAIRKSIISAFERKILISAVNEAQTSRHALRTAVTRFAGTCGPEIRSVLSATLRRARTMRHDRATPPEFAENLAQLEGNCQDIFGFLGHLADLLESMNGSTGKEMPRIGTA